MKKIFLFCMILALCIACQKKETAYKDDVEIDTLQEEVDGLLYHRDSLISYQPDDIRFYLDLPAELCTDCTVRAQTSSISIDEYGIFRTTDNASAERLTRLLNDYLARSLEGKREWLQSYNPAEITKLENSRVFRYGNYVIYLVLEPSTEEMVNKRVKEILIER